MFENLSEATEVIAETEADMKARCRAQIITAVENALRESGGGSVGWILDVLEDGTALVP